MTKKHKKSNQKKNRSSIYFVPEPGVPEGEVKEQKTHVVEKPKEDGLLLSLEAYRDKYKDIAEIDPLLLLRHLERQVENLDHRLSAEDKQRRVAFWENQYVTCVLNNQDPNGIY